MHPPELVKSVTSLQGGLCLLVLGVLALSGCAAPPSGDEPPVPQTGIDAPPGFDVGDSFTFDNPAETWSVVAIEDGNAIWQSDSGESQRTDMNPLLPALQWTSPEQGNGKRLLTNVQGTLFPLEVGAKTTFRSTVSMSLPPYAWEADWSCEIKGIEQVEVPAGNFVTFVVSCTRAGADVNTFNYAPALGHWVISTSRTGQGEAPRSRRLVSFNKVRPVTLVIGTDPSGKTVVSAESGEAPQAEAMPAPEPADAKMAMKAEPAMAAPKPAMPKSDGKEAAASKPTGSPLAATRTGGHGLHLASYKNRANVDGGWRQYMSRNGDLLAGLQPVVKRVNLKSKGTFYRLMAGPVQDRGDAQRICKALSARGIYCKVMPL